MNFPYVQVSRGAESLRVVVTGQPSATLGTAVNFGGFAGGVFANWKWHDNELTAQVDPFGMFNLFYSTTADGIMLSTSPIQLIALGANPDRDETALMVFHMLGWYVNEDTAFRHIKVLPPGGRLTWRNGKTSIGSAERTTAAISISREQAIAEYARLFSNAVRSCWDAVDGKMVIPLSGGRDSRHILLESVRQGIPPDHCVTYSPLFEAGIDPEWECANRVTTQLGIRHVKIKTLQSRFSEQLETIYLAHLGSDEHVQCLAARRYLVGMNCTDGIAGDSLSRNKNFTDPPKSQLMRDGMEPSLVAQMLMEIDRINQTSLAARLSSLKSELAGSTEAARQQIALCLQQYRQAADPYPHFLFWSRTRREISLVPSAILGTAKAVFCPYLDPALANFCLSLPSHVTADAKFHDHIIQKSFPELRLPYQDDMKPHYPRPPVAAKMKSIMDGVISASVFGLRGLLGEPLDQLRMLASRNHRRLHVWRTYHRVLDAVSDRQKAIQFLSRCGA